MNSISDTTSDTYAHEKYLAVGILTNFEKIVIIEGLSRCFVRQWVSGFLFEIVDTAVIKTLLVLRLRAFYGNNKSVTAILILATAVELMSTTYAYVLAGVNLQQFIASPGPIPGCQLRPGNFLHHYRSPTVVWATRLTSNSLELILLLFGLYRSLQANGSYFRNGWAQIRQAAPLLYVFYRDGTIFYIPLCALSIFGFAATLTRLTRELTCSNWEAWLGITYYIVGTRLTLNIRQAGLQFTKSMLTGHGQKLSSLVFSPDREATLEGDVATLESPQTRSTVEVLEVSEATKDDSSSG
ncbi:hypothetical protein AGABI2DRAFT_119780 [Agaricus bisporus var. bisporus H97]|uniref:hypothetical protein n=1 Tax=Agaricus bisporus var. bisporus (strain H97 / ATCC MYA-4626 / FGSC 10389) TaxID=936046 RepID=UPI00029F6C7F|nr:hypothetical protein AGABI2DRAFT_119780 [Agaricus bisporus var. bisporus H97]EKV46126.1 hypothetical protein AGABI2DRAFT_119780 [Agaricus bisporus var. bisporus H97]